MMGCYPRGDAAIFGSAQIAADDHPPAYGCENIVASKSDIPQLGIAHPREFGYCTAFQSVLCSFAPQLAPDVCKD